jgi:Phage integrase family
MLLPQAGVPIKVVQERLGHKQISITLGIYAHALPSMQQDAAANLAALLHSQPHVSSPRLWGRNKKGLSSDSPLLHLKNIR